MDGVRDEWVVARVEADRVDWSVHGTVAEVLAATEDCAAVGVDIPLGLPVGATARACEVTARTELRQARASVFLTPPREVLRSGSHAEACAVALRLTGKAISRQSFGIGPKILAWDAVVDRPAHVVEVHPELSFRRLAPGVEFASKKSALGAGQRITALTGWLGPALALTELPDRVALDDALDALAAGWSARRWARREHTELGPEPDDRGRPTCIVV